MRFIINTGSSNAAHETIGQSAAILSVVELGLGGILHAFHIPLSGHALSLNQGFLLVRAEQRLLRQGSLERIAAMQISTIAALLKCLSPMGKRLHPMLAISAQGLLYNAGTLVCGRNALGFSVGMTLLGLWASAQPVLFYGLLYGEDVIKMAEYYRQMLQPIIALQWTQLAWAVGAFIVLKAMAGLVLVALAHKLSDEKVRAYEDALVKRAHRGAGSYEAIKTPALETRDPKWTDHALGALRDLLRPSFLVSLALMLVFLFFSESRHSRLIWQGLRPLAIGWLIFFLARVLPLEKFFAKSQNGPASRFRTALGFAYESIKKL